MAGREENKKFLEGFDFDENKVYIVLGCHRSGTSFLSKALYDQGVDMGCVNTYKEAWDRNVGYYENSSFVSLNTEINHKLAGSTWSHPSGEKAIAKAAEKKEEEIVKLLGDSEAPFWGWKDPRTALTLEHFLPHIDGDVYLIGIFRRPAKVADSLNRRNKMPIGQGKQLAKEYNRRIIKAIKNFVGLD